VQGIVAARHYARAVALVDLNPRAVRFARFNLNFNNLGAKGRVYHGSLYEALPVRVTDLAPVDRVNVNKVMLKLKFDAILANPPYVPNPERDNSFASGGNMFGHGGTDGERIMEVLQCVAVQSECLSRTGSASWRCCSVLQCSQSASHGRGAHHGIGRHSLLLPNTH
jgi:hypothetical protein